MNAFFPSENKNVDSDRKSENANNQFNFGAIECLCFAAAFHDIRADPKKLKRSVGAMPSSLGNYEIALAAKELKIKAKESRFSWTRLKKAPLPAIAQFRDGTYFVIVQHFMSQIAIHDPRSPETPKILDQATLEANWTGNVILLKCHGSEVDTNRKFDIGWFREPIFQHKRIFVEIIIAALFVQIFSFATPLLTQVIFDKVVVHQNISTLHVLGLGMAVIIIFESILSYLQGYFTAHTGTRIDVLLGSKVFAHLLGLPLKYFERRRVGDTVANIREMDSIRQFLTGASAGVVVDTFFIGIFLLVLFSYSAELTIVVMCTLPFFIALTVLARPKMERTIKKLHDCSAQNQSFLVEIVTGIQTVKSLAIEPILSSRWSKMLAKHASASFSSSNTNAILVSIGQLIQRFATLAILWKGASLVIANELSVGELIAFQMLAARVIQPIIRLVQVWQELNNVKISVEKLGDIMNGRTETAKSVTASSSDSIFGKIEFSNVVFRYSPKGAPALNRLTFSVLPGQTVGIVGRSGCGKSTLSKLMQQLYRPETGEILVDGNDLSSRDPAWLRSQIGVVLQDNHLFSGSISENITIQKPFATAEEVIRAAKLAGAHDFISTMPGGYDTQTGERGIALSGGQRQRIAIARALITDPRVLIFDEATSALDSESESLIQKNLSEICNGRTVFIIAHRLSTIRNADVIFVLDKGSIVESGNHLELIALKGHYYNLFFQQDLLNDFTVFPVSCAA
ncbi:peptidase domain-containing ABC transporter [Duganella levis]|uniref:Type I secretion system permease/ATPase n=1 Tax=Duganella levis TaxID=2692169 RepID=A0ABW9W800_9BURK|nr:type I secretion system permease/ATPase [Duganella levis]MYN30111.1 type I secretion system permease/ATPase [Duganella levis]